ncbi:MAG: phenylalanine--tRNA ligase subunit beta [Pseudomonadota bacterium]
MKFTLGWLKDHLETEASIDELSTALSAIGLEVDGIEDPAEALGAFTIARVVDAAKHPDADKLQVLQVEIAPGKPTMEVVCGAPNARAGMLAVFAPIGTYVPGLDVTLVKKPVRGVESNGMMCSAAELELSDDSDGIIDVDDAFSGQVGERYIDAMGLNDPVFDVALTPNRPDCTGVRGIARDLAAAGLGRLKPARDVGDDVDGETPCPIPIDLKFDPDSLDACPVFAGRLIEGVVNGPSPDWLQHRLTAIGLRPINALVDVTNYISYDLGRPLHVYDADKLTGTVHARLGKAGETFVGLDETSYDVDDAMCVIADDSGVLGFGGVMGGIASGSTEATTRVLIESAWFDPIRTAATGRKTGLTTDARYRFERGVDPQSVVPGLDLATRMILDICGGTPSKKLIAGHVPHPEVTIDFDPARVEKLTGLKLPDAEIERILTDLEFDVRDGKQGRLTVRVPTWRPDVEGSADLVEEVVRIARIDNVPATPLPGLDGVARPTLTHAQKQSRRARRTLAARGLVEAITWSFIPRGEAETFVGEATLVELDNPISVDLSTMRPSLLPGLLSAAQRNRNRGFDDAALFELGQAYRGAGPTDQMVVAAGVRSGTAKLEGGGRHWDGAADPVSVFDAKADVMAVLSTLGLDPEKPQITRDAPDWYHPGQSGTLRLGPKTVLGYFGVVNPRTLKSLDMDDAPTVAFEIFLGAIPSGKKKATRAKPPLSTGDLMPVRRDFAFVVNDDVAASQVIKAARGAEKALIADVSVFDVFAGGQLAEQGQKSLALEVTLQPMDETLTDKDIEAVSNKVIAAVKKATGGEIRG